MTDPPHQWPPSDPPGEMSSAPPPLPGTRVRPPPIQPGTPAAKRQREQMILALSSIGTGVAIVTFLCTLGNPPGPLVLLNYLGLIAGCAGSVFLLYRRWPWRMPCYAGSALAVVMLLVYVSVDHYTIEWTRVWDEDTLDSTDVRWPPRPLPEGADTLWIDTYKRWRARHIYRQVVFRKDPESSGDLSPSVRAMEGPMSASGKPHGQWSYLFENPVRADSVPGVDHSAYTIHLVDGSDEWWWLQTKVDHQWFWYGEKISEGDWHLRNK